VLPDSTRKREINKQKFKTKFYVKGNNSAAFAESNRNMWPFQVTYKYILVPLSIKQRKHNS